LASRYGLQIRTASSADAAAIAELMDAGGHAIPASVLAERLEALRHQPGVALLALEWGPPSGLVVLTWHRTLAADLPVAQITTLLVGPDERRRGIGRLLLKAAAQAARSAGCGTMHLFAPAGEPSLAAFCKATGFDEAGTGYTRPLRKRG
jgi:aminoglycoside 6'-N-acetyltransferase I